MAGLTRDNQLNFHESVDRKYSCPSTRRDSCRTSLESFSRESGLEAIKRVNYLEQRHSKGEGV